MGLATIDPHSQKEHTDIHKIPIIQMLYPRAKAIDQIPTLCPFFPRPPRRLDIDRCIIYTYVWPYMEANAAKVKFFVGSQVTSTEKGMRKKKQIRWAVYKELRTMLPQ